MKKRSRPDLGIQFAVGRCDIREIVRGLLIKDTNKQEPPVSLIFYPDLLTQDFLYLSCRITHAFRAFCVDAEHW